MRGTRCHTPQLSVLVATLLTVSSADLVAQAEVRAALDRLRAVPIDSTVPLDTVTIKRALALVESLLPLDGDSALRVEVATTYAAVALRLVLQRLGYEPATALLAGALRYAPEASEAPRWGDWLGLASASYSISVRHADASGWCDAIRRFHRSVAHALAALEAARAVNPHIGDRTISSMHSLLDEWHVCWPSSSAFGL